MRDFEARWRELASSAGRADDVEAPPSSADAGRFVALALARRASDVAPVRRRRTSELVALAAAAALVLVSLACWLPDRDTWGRVRGETAAELASLSRRVPRAPRLPSPSLALEIVPDVPAWWRASFDVETRR